MSKITRYQFSKLYEMSSGISSTKEQAGHGAPFASFSVVFNNYFLPDQLDDKMNTSIKEQETFSIKKGDILITRTSETIDELAMSCIALKDYPCATYSGFVKRLRPLTKGVADDKYMAFYLRSKLFRKTMTNNASMTLRASFNEDIFSFLDLFLPDFNDQIKIGNLLYAIEKKIQLNNKINETLQKQAKDIYMHLFFRKTPNGKIADILLENEKSTIQVGEAKAATGSHPFFTSGEAILGWKTPLVKGRNCFLNTGGNADVKFYVGNAAYSTDTWCIAAKNALSDYLYLLLSSIKVELNQKFFQGTGLKHLQKELLKDRPIYIPDEKEISAFNKTICPMFDMISEKTRETQELTALRDWLLPMLMNGQATVVEEQKPVLRVIENDTKNEQPDRFALWLQNQGLAARGDIDRQTLREIFDAMDEDDK